MKTTKQVKTPKQSTPLYRILKDNPGLILPLKDGDVVEGKLLAKDGQKAYFELKNRTIGVIYGIELLNALDILKNINIGDMSTVTVVEEENKDGYAELSLIKAARQKSWADLKVLKNSGEVVNVKIKGANSGGLTTEAHGIKAFIPVSQLSVDKYPHVEDGNKEKILEELSKLIGEEFDVKIIDIDQNDNKLILSERELDDDSVRKTLSKYKIGDDVDVIISGIADFGVFVRLKDNSNVEGLVHISEIDHKLIKSPSDVVKVGEEVRARVIEIKNGKISFSLKALKPNPWDKVNDLLKEGDVIDGTITRFNQFGALVSIGNDLQGLIHISEFEDMDKMKEVLEEGKSYKFEVFQLKPEEKRIILKLKK